MNKLVTMYIIPDKEKYVERARLFGYDKTEVLDPNIPTVIVINDSNYHYGKEFMVAYKNTIQTTGGGGSCYNPKFLEINKHREYEVKYIIEGIGKYYTKNIPFSNSYIWSRVAAAKFDMLQKMGYKDELPMFYWNTSDYNSKMFGLLCGKLDLIGMGKAPVSIIKEEYSRREQKLLEQA